ncbi:DUF6777 domain-containing protein [Streptomyces sp. SID2119]|uniref:DUF6777 domain-containing protein n=1 Tax=Streptomyces sp. SID2119 TaxID=2690253 RepID=UPI001F3383CE|nr:DUF6777 domain-containing protein [Streptomyces sp. SID2119]
MRSSALWSAGTPPPREPVASCDVEKQISTLRAAPDKNRAFASVKDIEPSAVPDHLGSLTPVLLRMETRVTKHGFRGGSTGARRWSWCSRRRSRWTSS